MRPCPLSGWRWAWAGVCLGAPLIVCSLDLGASGLRAASGARPRVDRREIRAAGAAGERLGARFHLVLEPEPAAVPAARDRDARSRAVDALAVGIAITGLLTTLFGIGERRWRQLAGLALFLLGIALYAGCDPLRSTLRVPKAAAWGKASPSRWRPASA